MESNEATISVSQKTVVATTDQCSSIAILREAMERVVTPKKLPLRVTSWPEGGR